MTKIPLNYTTNSQDAYLLIRKTISNFGRRLQNRISSSAGHNSVEILQTFKKKKFVLAISCWRKSRVHRQTDEPYNYNNAINDNQHDLNFIGPWIIILRVDLLNLLLNSIVSTLYTAHKQTCTCTYAYTHVYTVSLCGGKLFISELWGSGILHPSCERKIRGLASTLPCGASNNLQIHALGLW